ncbi:hypothetical protein [Sutterella wadsworthensis]|uniref:hypothetical protein n=1 Tax=Sutterella wadsworthensis TaxID=40545 RepID=UPI003AB33C8E
MGVTPVIICGNHDAEFREANDLGSAINALKGIGCQIINTPTWVGSDSNVLCLPWTADKKTFLKSLRFETPDHEFDVVCHAAFEGVFSHVHGDSCLRSDDIFGSGSVRRVFAGHLHNHKLIYNKDGHKIYSVGAIAQHNWGDVGSKAGFMLVGENDEQFIGSNAPQFIDATPGMSYADLAMEAEGNYLRVTVDMTEKEVKKYRDELQKLNPKGLTVICHTPIEKRVDRIEVKSSESLEATVDRYMQVCRNSWLFAL